MRILVITILDVDGENSRRIELVHSVGFLSVVYRNDTFFIFL